VNLCGARWDYGGYEPDRPWHGTPCIRPAGHGGWHESGICDPPVTNGRITWLAAR
jgi:hypothetical protein